MNIVDYVKWRGDLTFKNDPFNDVDNLVLSTLVYLDWTSVVDAGYSKSISLKKASEVFLALGNQLMAPLVDTEFELLKACAASKRFGDLRLFNYVEDFNKEEIKQFAAVTFKLAPFTYYVAYRGTDHSLVGWEENFNMTINDFVPAQICAVNYLNDTIKNTVGNYYVGGHSKGANLAVYGACNSIYHHRILKIFSNDGPGFSESFIKSDSYRKNILKIKAYTPTGSVVGRLLNWTIKPEIVYSDGKDLFLQHDPYSWQVDVKKFIRDEKTSSESDIVVETLNEWNERVNKENKQSFIRTLFDCLYDMNIEKSWDIVENRAKVIANIGKDLPKMDEQTRKTFLAVTGNLFKTTTENILENIKNNYLTRKETEDNENFSS